MRSLHHHSTHYPRCLGMQKAMSTCDSSPCPLASPAFRPFPSHVVLAPGGSRSACRSWRTISRKVCCSGLRRLSKAPPISPNSIPRCIALINGHAHVDLCGGCTTAQGLQMTWGGPRTPRQVSSVPCPLVHLHRCSGV